MKQEAQNKHSFWDTGIGSFIRRIFVLAIVWLPLYFASEEFGGNGFIVCLIVEFILLIAIVKLVQAFKKKRKGASEESPES